MIPNYTQEEFDNAKSDDLMPLVCEHCGKIFYVCKKKIKSNIKLNKITRNRFCSQLCMNLHKNKTHICKCENCDKEFLMAHKDYIRSKNHFCSQSCSAIYNNKHKTSGTRRSKLESYLEKELLKLYPNIDFIFNGKDIINSELDIFIPKYNIAFELNGIFHYKPIYGEDKFERIQNNDKEKLLLCEEKDIKLYVIDTSNQKHFKEETSQPFLNFICDKIEKAQQV